MEPTASSRQPTRFPFRLGFVPLSDCAPIAVAREMGIFDRYGLDVVLSRELNWANVREKMIDGELDAAQSIAGIAFALGLGFSALRCDVVVPLIFNLHGKAVILANEFTPSEIGQHDGLKNHLLHSWKKNRPFTLAAPHRYSARHILLHQWLQGHGLDAEDGVQIIFLPPSLMLRHLQAGLIDGFCVGEPWNSEALMNGSGWCPATFSDASRAHQETVLLVSGKCLHERRAESIALVAALLDACQLCQDPLFREDLISILSSKEYTGASRAVLRNGFPSPFDIGREFTNDDRFPIFYGDCVNRPTVKKASWLLAGLRTIGALPDITCGSLSRIYREDIFHAAQHSREKMTTGTRWTPEVTSGMSRSAIG